MSAKNALKGYGYQVNVLNAFVQKMDLKRNIKKIESESEVKHNFDDMVIIDENENHFYFQVKNYETFDINNIKIEDKIVKVIPGNTNSYCKYNPNLINGIIVNNDFKCDSEILGFKSKLIDGIYIIPLTENNYDEQVGEYINISRKEHMQTQVINKISNSLFEFTVDELPKLSLFSNDLKHKTIKFNKLPEIIDKLSWHLGAPGTGKSHLVKEIDDINENSIVYRFYADKHDQKRLVFENFLEDFTQRIFKTPEKKTFKEIVRRIVEDDLLIIIDGLDHVYNYQTSDLDKFLEFFDLLKNTKTLIFSRPFPEIIEKENVFTIPTWNKEDTFKYLEQYKFDNDINDKIYDLTNGYPIITYYLSEHYKLNKDLTQYNEPLNSIEDYYQSILDTADLQYPLELFLICNTYILESEIEYLLDQNSSKILVEFIEKYPYFFTKELNRIRLFHDSLFTYLRNKSEMNYDYSLNKVKESILSKKINFLSRFNTFDFDDDFIKEVLKLYCSFDTFEEISSNFDFESIKIFYISLKSILPNFENVLNVYQYYSFILITLIVERHDYHHVPELFYNLFWYADRNNINEESIYSNGVLWSLYVYYKTDDLNLYKKQLEKEFYDNDDLINNLNVSWDYEDKWTLNHQNTHVTEEKIKKYIIETHDHKLFEKYLAYVYITNQKESDYYILIKNYIQNSFKKYHEEYFNDICDEFRFFSPFKENILKNARIKIYEHGLLKEENIFLNIPLTEFMKSLSNKLSCNIYDYLIGYIRLYNHLDNDFDFTEIFKYLNMYFFRKDHSVVNLDKALLTFEKHDCITECESVKLINNTMIKSEKGIRGLLTNYLNQKPPQFIEKINPYWNDLEVFSFDLNYERINNVLTEHVAHDAHYVLSSYTDYDSIRELLKSKYKLNILLILKTEKMKVINVLPDSTQIFKDNGIDYEIQENKKQTKFDKRNYLVKNDLEYIKQHKIDYMKLASLTDGFNHSLPYVEFFEIYDFEELRKNCLKIIHKGISTKERYFNKHPAIWYLYLGNIPYLLDMIDYDVDWHELFEILMNYLKESSIYL